MAIDRESCKTACTKLGIEFDESLRDYADQHSHMVIDRRDNCPDRSKPWHLICGPGPRNGGEIASFATREEAVAFAKAHGIAVRFGDTPH